MTENPTASDWASARGEKWRGHLAGMEAMMAPVDQPLIGELQLDAPYRIADIGCGGGRTALEVLRRAPAGSVVHGFDISPPLIELARARAGTGERAAVFQIADVATAAPEAAYHRLVSRFGIMFFDDPPAAFANLARWLSVGGRFAFAAWGSPADNPWITNVREVVAAIVDLPRPDPDAPGPFRYGEVDKLLRLLDGAGLEELDVREWRGALPIGGNMPAADAANFALASFSSFGELLEAAGIEAFDTARRALTARFAGIEKAGAVRMDACVHVVTGVRLR